MNNGAGATRSPRRRTVTALEKVLGYDSYYRNADSKDEGESDLCMVREAAADYNLSEKDLFDENDHSHTVEEYLSLPDNLRVELIDGTFYRMHAPSYEHQEIIACIAIELRNFVRNNKGECKVIISPFDIQLDEDDKTMVQPDIVVICKREHLDRKRGYGAPDMVVEVLSPSTAKKDSDLKLRKYMKAGVREYWIVDPDKKQVIVYVLNEEDGIVFPSVYDFNDIVPVAIWDGRCKVDFSGIDTEI